jgi:hypothetical protein
LNLVNYDQLVSVTREKRCRMGQSRPIRFALHIEKHGIPVLRHNGVGKRCFTDLARPQQNNRRLLAQTKLCLGQ